MVRYELVAYEADCKSSKKTIFKGCPPTPEECAQRCMNVSTLFIHPSDNLEVGCNDYDCMGCYCELMESADGMCDQLEADCSYNLYRIIREGKRSFVFHIIDFHLTWHFIPYDISFLFINKIEYFTDTSFAACKP